MIPTCLTYIGILVPFVISILYFFGRIERRLTKIETDICWIKKVLPTCLPNLGKTTQ